MLGYLQTLSSRRFENLSLCSIRIFGSLLRAGLSISRSKSMPTILRANSCMTLETVQWDLPKLRLLLGKIVPEQGAMENYEVEHDFPSIGRRTTLLNARKVSRVRTPQSCLALRTLPTNASSKTKRMI
jgi:hypothetical protein